MITCCSNMFMVSTFIPNTHWMKLWKMSLWWIPGFAGTPPIMHLYSLLKKSIDSVFGINTVQISQESPLKTCKQLGYIMAWWLFLSRSVASNIHSDMYHPDKHWNLSSVLFVFTDLAILGTPVRVTTHLSCVTGLLTQHDVFKAQFCYSTERTFCFHGMVILLCRETTVYVSVHQPMVASTNNLSTDSAFHSLNTQLQRNYWISWNFMLKSLKLHLMFSCIISECVQQTDIAELVENSEIMDYAHFYFLLSKRLCFDTLGMGKQGRRGYKSQRQQELP